MTVSSGEKSGPSFARAFLANSTASRSFIPLSYSASFLTSFSVVACALGVGAGGAPARACRVACALDAGAGGAARACRVSSSASLSSSAHTRRKSSSTRRLIGRLAGKPSSVVRRWCVSSQRRAKTRLASGSARVAHGLLSCSSEYARIEAIKASTASFLACSSRTIASGFLRETKYDAQVVKMSKRNVTQHEPYATGAQKSARQHSMVDKTRPTAGLISASWPCPTQREQQPERRARAGAYFCYEAAPRRRGHVLPGVGTLTGACE